MTLEELKAVIEAATEGPWTFETDPEYRDKNGKIWSQKTHTVYSGRGPTRHGLNLFGRLEVDWNGENNLKYLTTSRTALPNALARLDEMACALVHADKAWAGDEESATMAQSALNRYEAFKADVTAKVGGE